MNSSPLGTVETIQDLSLGVISNNEAELIDKVMLLDNDDCNYLNLIAECIAEISQAEVQDDTSSVEIISDTCRVYKYYTETAAASVEKHFSRSLPEGSVKLIETNMNEKAPQTTKRTGAARRKARRKPTVTSLMPSRAQVTMDARVHPYALMQPACPQQPSLAPPLQNSVETCGGAYYMSSMPQQYCLQYQAASHNIKNESVRESDFKPPVYTAFCKGNTLVEVYSPTVGRGFNPRFNSLLIQPTVQAFLPPITGLARTMSAAMADIHAFHHMAIEFNIPS